MKRYNFVDPSAALEVQNSLLRHQWYLTQEMVILALFDKEVSDEQKGKINKAYTCLLVQEHG